MEIPRSSDRDAYVREEIYARLKLPEAIVRELERMVGESPSRHVGGGALRNTITIRDSHKSSKKILSESHTNEGIFYDLCDTHPGVLAFYSQPRLMRVLRPKGQGFHVSSCTLDALVFYSDRIEVVECKHQSDLKKLIDANHKDWLLEDGQYIHVPARNWAMDRQIGYCTWSPPGVFGRYQSNLSTLRGGITDQLSDEDKAIVSSLVSLCAERGPQTISVACMSIAGCTRFHIMQALLTGSIVGTLLSDLIIHDSFLIGSPGSPVEVIDGNRLKEISLLKENPVIRDEFLVHPAKHREIATKRFNLIQQMRDGKIPWTRTYHELSRYLHKIDANPAEMLRYLLPNYSKSGNRTPRAHPEQFALLDSYVDRWQHGEFNSVKMALDDYRIQSEEKNIAPLSDTTFRGRLKLADPARRALATEGIRGYQHVKSRTPPLSRGQPSQLSGHTVHIDSTLLDVRSGPVKEFGLPAERASIYIARDVRGRPLARSFILGHARTDGLAILWRQYVFRNGELPVIVHLDKGPENTSKWHQQFAHGRFDLRFQPTGAAASNQPAEDLLNHINSNISHGLEGNTLPDKMGRSVDGRFKSMQTARLGIQLICKLIDDYLFDEGGWIQRNGDEAIDCDYKRRQMLFGMGGGRPCLYDDEFLVATSCPIKTPKYSQKNGIRTTDGYYLDDEMQVLLRNHRPEEVRIDCIDASIIYVKIIDRWFRALREDTWVMQDMSYDERISHLMTERESVASSRSLREACRKDFHRQSRKETQRVLNERHAPPVASTPVATEVEFEPGDESLADALPFERLANGAD